jgi:hypothetical protein
MNPSIYQLKGFLLGTDPKKGIVIFVFEQVEPLLCQVLLNAGSYQERWRDWTH